MSTAQELAALGVRHIKKRHWAEGRVYIDGYHGLMETWGFIHPTDTPGGSRPLPVRLHMLEGDDWEEVPHSGDE